MNASLPEPGSVWAGVRHGVVVAVRVVISKPEEIVAHNCEIAMRDNLTSFSWVGTHERFMQVFRPHPNPETYPKTAEKEEP